MGDKKDKEVFEDYLKGNSSLSQRYRSESAEEPPVRLDAVILTAAKKSLANKVHGAGSYSRRWYVPISLAAVIVISFSVVFRIYDKESLPAGNRYPETKIEDRSVLEDSRLDQLSGGSESMIEDGIDEIKAKRDSNKQLLKRETETPPAPALQENIGQDKQIPEQDFQDRSRSQLSVDEPAKKIMRDQTFEITVEEEYRGKAESLPAETETVKTLKQEQAFKLIKQLWIEGNQKDAYKELENFMRTYPEYPVEELKKRLPEGMDLAEKINE